MKPKLILCLALVLSGLQPNCFGATDTTQTRLEQMATNYSHFSLETVIKNRPLRLWGEMEEPKPGVSGPVVWKPNPLVEEQTRLVQELRSLDGDRPALAALLKHPDPKMRTLALGALFQREDGRELDRHYSLWATNASIPPRLSKAVLTIFPSLTNASVNPQLKGQMWCNAVWMLGESHDLAMVSVLRPYLQEKDLAYDPGTLGDGINTSRICDDAARAINLLLNLKLEFPRSDMFLFGGHNVLTNGTNVISWKSHSAAGVNIWSGSDPTWEQWDKKIVELQKRLDALPEKK